MQLRSVFLLDRLFFLPSGTRWSRKENPELILLKFIVYKTIPVQEYPMFLCVLCQHEPLQSVTLTMHYHSDSDV